MHLSATVLGARDPQALAEFYANLLGWTITRSEPAWVMVRPPNRGTGLSFQLEADFVPPVWPPQQGEEQMHSHLDIAVENRDEGVAWALENGARLAEHQPNDGVRVMLDPAGHPFCLFESAAYPD